MKLYSVVYMYPFVIIANVTVYPGKRQAVGGVMPHLLQDGNW